MLLLTSTSDALQIVTGQAGSLDVHASWVDNSATAVTPGRTNTAITTATTTTVLAAPGASTQRNVKTLTARNKGAGSLDVTVRHTDGTTMVELYKTTLPPGQTLEYVENAGFTVISAVPSARSAPGFSAHKNGTAQSGLSSTPTKLTFGSVAFNDAGWDTTNSKWTPPAGKVQLTATIGMTGMPNASLATVAIYKNGAALKAYQAFTSAGSTFASVEVSIIDQANGTDYYEVYGYNSSGTPSASGDTSLTFVTGAYLGS